MNEERTRWSGWIVFASIMLMIGGIVNAFYGVVAIVNDTWVVWNNQNTLVLDFTAWGWLLLSLGTVAFLAGIGLLTGNLVARIIAVAMASLSIITNFMFLPAFPLWALTVMVIDALVIYAVCAHGAEMKPGAESVIDVRAEARPASIDQTRTGTPVS